MGMSVITSTELQTQENPAGMRLLPGFLFENTTEEIMADIDTEIKFESWAQYTSAARSFIPAALGYDEIWTQGALAAMLGVDSNYISMVERGSRKPGKQFQLTLGYLIIMARNRIDPRNA